MSDLPSNGERPPLQGIRRSFTLPARQLSFHEKAGLDKTDANAEILYSHPSARIISFSPPTDSIKSTNKTEIPADTDYPVDTVETLPWRSRTETLIATGPMIIEKVRGSTNFLKCQNVMHAILRNSQCWCVDGESKFVLRVRKLSYYRIELPSTTEDDKAKVEELKKVFPTVLRYERTPCPFIRAFTVDLPDDAITPRRKGQWKRRDSSLPNTPDSETPPLRRTKPERSWSARTPPTSYPKHALGSALDGERGRTGNSVPLYRRSSLFDSHRNSSPASFNLSEDGTDSERHVSDHDSEMESTTDRSETGSPRKGLDEPPAERTMDGKVDAEEMGGSSSRSGLDAIDDDTSVEGKVLTHAVQATPRDGDDVSKHGGSQLDHVEEVVKDKTPQKSVPDIHFSPKENAALRPEIIQAPSSTESESELDDSSTMTMEEQRRGGLPNPLEQGNVSSPIENRAPAPPQDIQTGNCDHQKVGLASQDVKEMIKSQELSSEDDSDVSSEHQETHSFSQIIHGISAQPSPVIQPEQGYSLRSLQGPISNTEHGLQTDSLSQPPLTSSGDIQQKSQEISQPVKSLGLPFQPAPTYGPLERQGVTPASDSGVIQTVPSTTRTEDQHKDDDSDDDDQSTVSSIDSFHTMASPLQASSRGEEADAIRNPIMDQLSYFSPTSPRHKRDISEITVTSSSLSNPPAHESKEPLQQESERSHGQPPLRPFANDPSGAEPVTTASAVQDEDGLRQRLKARRSFSPLPPASTIFTGNQIRHDSGSGHMTKSILQKVIITPIEVAVLVMHVLARIASGATVNDLLSGELFKRPPNQRRVSDFADQLRGGTGQSDTEDDYGVPIRGRRRSFERRVAMVFDEEDEDNFEDVD